MKTNQTQNALRPLIAADTRQQGLRSATESTYHIRPMTYTITYADGTAAERSATHDDALSVIATRYSVTAGELVTEESEERTLVWLGEESAENDDGARAVAEIRETGSSAYEG